ncbi:MAG TPA: NAD(P)-dependent oxidoreductase [bacterium]|nr:NAD(P)-dependent oxidoreductase [bacterium]
MSKERIGFIGLGVMGGAMAGHIANAGYELSIYDIENSASEKVAAAHPGIKVMQSPAEIAEASDIVITMLPSGKYVQETAIGEKGLIRGFRPGSILLDTSSCEPWLTTATAKILAEANIVMVDAPVSGAQVGAMNAELVFMVGGDNASVTRVSPLLEIMGKKIFHLGPVGSGHAMKCINNLITSVTFLATTEGLAIGKAFGLNPDVMTDVLNVSTGESWISRTHIKQRIISRKFDDPFKLGLMVKDIGIAMKLASEMDLPAELSETNQRVWLEAEKHAGAETSVSKLAGWVEQITGVEISVDNTT